MYNLVTAMQKSTKIIFMKYWETEMLALDFTTGLMVKVISSHTFKGKTLSEAQEALLKSGIPYIRLTGVSYEHTEEEETALVTTEEVDAAVDAYEEMIDPNNFVREMTLDEFCDWLEIGLGESNHEASVRATLAAFKKAGLVEHTTVIQSHLNHFYGDKEN